MADSIGSPPRIVNNKIATLAKDSWREMSTIGERVREEREKRGWSVSELARRSGVPRWHIQQIESGAFKEPRTPVLSKLAGPFNVNVDDLRDKVVTRKDTPYDRNPELRNVCDRLEAVDPETQRRVLRVFNEVLALAENVRVAQTDEAAEPYNGDNAASPQHTSHEKGGDPVRLPRRNVSAKTLHATQVKAGPSTERGSKKRRRL